MLESIITVEWRPGSDEETFAALMKAAGSLDDHHPTSDAWLLRDFVVRVPIAMKSYERHLEAVVTGWGTYQPERRPLLELLLKLYGPVRIRVANPDGTPNYGASGNDVRGWTPSAGTPSAHEMLAANARIREALAAKSVPPAEIERLLAA